MKALSSQIPMPTMGSAMVPQSSPAMAQLAQLDAQIVAMSQTLGPNHPDLIAMKGSRSRLASTAAQDQANVVAQMRASRATAPSIDGQVAAQQNKVLANREKVDELRKMQAVIDVLRDQSQKVMGRATELSVEAGSTESGLTLLGNAVAPATPSWPDVPLISGVALIGGFVLGLLIAMTSELLGRRVRGPEDLALVGVPVIGMIAGQGRADREKSWREWLGFGARPRVA